MLSVIIHPAFFWCLLLYMFLFTCLTPASLEKKIYIRKWFKLIWHLFIYSLAFKTRNTKSAALHLGWLEWLKSFSGKHLPGPALPELLENPGMKQLWLVCGVPVKCSENMAHWKQMNRAISRKWGADIKRQRQKVYFVYQGRKFMYTCTMQLRIQKYKEERSSISEARGCFMMTRH